MPKTAPLSAHRTPSPLPFPTALLLLLAACGKPGGSTPGSETVVAKAQIVRVAPVTVRKVLRTVETTGFLESEHQVTVLSKIQGRVVSVGVDEGSVVKKGQVLAKLDPREAQASLTQTEVLLEDRKVRRELQKLEVDASKRRVEQAKNDRARLEAEWRRYADMDPTLISPKILQDSKFAFDNSDEAMRVAEFNQRKAVLDEKAAENLIRELEAKLDDARIKLAEHEVVAPFDGVVSKRSIKGGETIGTATELFVVTDLENLVCMLARPQRELPLVRDAKEVSFTADGLPGVELTADVDLVSPVVDQATGSFKLRFRVRKPDARLLKPGMFVRAKILTEQLRDALMVPKAAKLTDGDVSYVFTVKAGTAHKVTFDSGLEERDFVEAKSRGDEGLTANDLVITGGHQDLKDQSPVEVQAETKGSTPREASTSRPASAGAAK